MLKEIKKKICNILYSNLWKRKEAFVKKTKYVGMYKLSHLLAYLIFFEQLLTFINYNLSKVRIK